MWSRLSSLLICTRGLATKERKKHKEKSFHHTREEEHEEKIILLQIILLKNGHKEAPVCKQTIIFQRKIVNEENDSQAQRKVILH